MKYCINVPEYTFVDIPCVYEVVEVKEPMRVVEVKTREQEWKEGIWTCQCPYYNMWKQPKPVKKYWFPKWFTKSEPKWLVKPEKEEVVVIDRYTILY